MKARLKAVLVEILEFLEERIDLAIDRLKRPDVAPPPLSHEDALYEVDGEQLDPLAPDALEMFAPPPRPIDDPPPGPLKGSAAWRAQRRR